MAIYLVRHGQDDPSRRGGWSNQPVTPEGEKQAEALAEYILRKNVPVDKILSSDLPRAMQTAVPIARRLGLPIVPMPQLREVNNGDLAGMDNALAEEKYPGLYWNTLGWETPYPNGESPKEFYERIQTAWDAVTEMDGNTLLVTHSGVIHVILALAAGRPYSNASKYPQIGHCELIEIL